MAISETRKLYAVVIHHTLVIHHTSDIQDADRRRVYTGWELCMFWRISRPQAVAEKLPDLIDMGAANGAGGAA